MLSDLRPSSEHHTEQHKCILYRCTPPLCCGRKPRLKILLDIYWIFHHQLKTTVLGINSNKQLWKFDKEAIVQLQRECSAVTGGRGGASPAQWVRRSDYLLECHSSGQGLQPRARDRTSVEQFIPSPYSGMQGENNLVHTMPWQVHVAIVKMTILS